MGENGNMRRETYDVVIGGGGFVGLALALAFTRMGPSLRVAIVDAAEPRAGDAGDNDGRASALTAASRQLLDAICVWPVLAQQAQPIRHIDVTDSPLAATLRPLFLQFDAALEDGAPAAHMVENHVLRAALVDAAAGTPSLAWIAPRRVTGLCQDRTGLSARLDDGSDLAARLLVAADGRRSTIRAAAGIKCVGWRYPQSGIVVTLAHEKPHGGRAVQHFLPAGPFAILPLTGNRSSLVWTEERARARAIMALDEQGFLAEAARRFGPRLGRLELAGPRVAYPLDMHIARSLVAERLALAGDAAHAVHPLAGQGLNIGLRDVAALAEVVIEAARLGLDVGSEPVLARYQRWRRFDSALAATAMDALNRLFSNDNAPLRLLRTAGLGLVDRAPALKRLLVREAAGLTGEVPRLLKGEPV